MAYGIEKLCQDIAHRASARTDYLHSAVAYHFESPIEQLFFTAIFRAISVHDGATEFVETYLGTPSKRLSFPLPEGTLGVELQYRALDWPADFALFAPFPGLKPVIVECDGHDFHERTKEQAARDRSRDRALQAGGFHVLRFTGSEIHREPLKCALEAIRLTERLFHIASKDVD